MSLAQPSSRIYPEIYILDAIALGTRGGLQPHACGEITRHNGESPHNGPCALSDVLHWAKSSPFVGVPKGYVDADPDVLQVRGPSFRAPTYTLFRIRTSATSALLIRQGQCYRVEEGARSGLLLLMVVVAPRPSPWNAVVVAAAAAATYCTTRLRR